MVQPLIRLLLRWARAYARAVTKDGVWIYAPPLVMGAANPIWRVAPPPRIREIAPAGPVAAVVGPVTDPRIVAARRASLRLIIGSQSVT